MNKKLSKEFDEEFEIMRQVDRDEVVGVFGDKEDREAVKQWIDKNFVAREPEEVNRVEVIDDTGRAYTFWEDKAKVELMLQDDNRTLKVFIRDIVKKKDKKTLREITMKEDEEYTKLEIVRRLRSQTIDEIIESVIYEVDTDKTPTIADEAWAEQFDSKTEAFWYGEAQAIKNILSSLKELKNK